MDLHKHSRKAGDTPIECPYGHHLGPGLVVVAWQPCMCSIALEAQWGHTIWRCRPCEDAGLTTIMYEPPHQRTAEEVERETEWVRAYIARMEKAGVGEEELGPYRRQVEESERLVEALRVRSTGNR